MRAGGEAGDRLANADVLMGEPAAFAFARPPRLAGSAKFCAEWVAEWLKAPVDCADYLRVAKSVDVALALLALFIDVHRPGDVVDRDDELQIDNVIGNQTSPREEARRHRKLAKRGAITAKRNL